MLVIVPWEILFNITNYTLIKNETPKRGDVIVFKYPENENINYIESISSKNDQFTIEKFANWCQIQDYFFYFSYLCYWC